MITILFDKDKFSLNITDSNLEGYIRILPLKNLILIMGEEGLELTVLDRNREFLYTFIEGEVTVEGVNLLGDIMGYHVALGNESNIKQVIEQDSLAYVGFEYLYSFEGNFYLYYGENFHMLPTLISTSSLTAGDWMDITDGVVSFSGGTIDTDKELISQKTISPEEGSPQFTYTTNRLLSSTNLDKMTFFARNDTDEKFLSDSEYRISSNSMIYETYDWIDNVRTSSANLVIQPGAYSLNIVNQDSGENELRISGTDTTISAYPNSRNDFPTGLPSNFLCTNEDGKIQSFNTGISAVISILGITLRFANGILVEYTD